MFRINETHHPIPDDRRRPPQQKRGGAERRYPFREMEVGDSFDVPVNFVAVTGRTIKLPTLSVLANNWSWRLNASFVVRHIEADSVFRCWRIR